MSADDPERTVGEEEADALSSAVQAFREFVGRYGSEGHAPLCSGFRIGRRLLKKDFTFAGKVSRIGWHTDVLLHQESSRDMGWLDRAEVSGNFFHFFGVLWDAARTKFC